MLLPSACSTRWLVCGGTSLQCMRIAWLYRLRGVASVCGLWAAPLFQLLCHSHHRLLRTQAPAHHEQLSRQKAQGAPGASGRGGSVPARWVQPPRPRCCGNTRGQGEAGTSVPAGGVAVPLRSRCCWCLGCSVLTGTWCVSMLYRRTSCSTLAVKQQRSSASQRMVEARERRRTARSERAKSPMTPLLPPWSASLT